MVGLKLNVLRYTRVLPRHNQRIYHGLRWSVKDHQVEELISKITDRLTGELGGKIFVVDVPIVVDIQTKKRGDDVI